MCLHRETVIDMCERFRGTGLESECRQCLELRGILSSRSGVRFMSRSVVLMCVLEPGNVFELGAGSIFVVVGFIFYFYFETKEGK